MMKKLMAILMVLCLITGMLPISVLAEDLTSGTLSKPKVEQTTVTVDYPDLNRSKATITYHKKGLAANSFNLIFLLDTSKQGEKSYKAFRQMMQDSGAGYIYDYDASSTIQIINYQNTVSSSQLLHTKSDLMMEIGRDGVVGEGTAKETAGLASAISAVERAKTNNNNPTVVFWVLGEQFGETDTAAIKAKLDELDNALTDGKDALITWQYADQPNELLKQYATQYTEAHDTSGQKYPAAYANKDPILMQEKMSADLEEIVHDHYHNIKFSLKLDDAQTVAKKITNVQYETESSVASLTTELWPDGRGIDVHIERQCRQTDIDFIIELDLETDVYEKQIVIPAGKIMADHKGENGGLHTGVFDEKIEYDMELDLPAVEVDRVTHSIIFQNADGISNITNKFVGEIVTLPMGDGITEEGASFGGWNVVSDTNQRRHYAPGEIISMPAEDMILEPVFGHVELTLEVDYEKGTPTVTGNQMTKEYSTALYFLNVTSSEGKKINCDDIVNIKVIDFMPDYDVIEDPDKRRVKLNNVADAVYARHIGETQTDKVVLYLVNSPTESGKYDMYIAGPGGVKAPLRCDSMFTSTAPNLKTLDLEKLDVSSVKSMVAMIGGSVLKQNLIEANVSGWDTSNVEDMRQMFSNCIGLKSLDLSSFDTSKVTDMSAMFFRCGALESLDLSRFDTSKVTNLSSMFSHCNGLKSLNVSNFDTSRVTDMSGMFVGCSNLESLDVSSFDTSQVTDISSMFYGCRGLTSLNVSHFNTSKVTKMYSMFQACTRLTSLDVSNFDTSQVISMSFMFDQCVSLTSLDVSGFDTSQVRSMDAMFSGCGHLTSLDVSGFDTSQVKNMSQMFAFCHLLTSLDVSGFDTTQVTNAESMFKECRLLTSLDVGHFNTSNMRSLDSMFRDCGNLTFLDLSNFDTAQVTDMDYMFSYCKNLSDLKFGDNFNISNVKTMKDMFAKCEKLKNITGIKLGETNVVSSFAYLFHDLKNLESVTFTTPDNGASFPNLSTMQNMFNGCTSLVSVNLNNWALPNLTNTSFMFNGCSNLADLDLSWSDIRANVYDISQMFDSVPSTAQLKIGSDTSPMLLAIKDAFPGNVTASNTLSANVLNVENGVSVDNVPEGDVVDGNALDDNTLDDNSMSGSEVVEDSSADSSMSDSEVVGDGVPNNSSTESGNTNSDTVDGNHESASSEMKPDFNEFSVLPSGVNNLTVLSAPVSSNTSGNGNIYVHPTKVNGGDTITYKATVKYVGDVGAKSGRITLEFPIPEDVQRFVGDPTSAEYMNPGWYEATTDIAYSDAPTGYIGGRIVEEPKVVEDGKGGYVLRGVFEGLYTGTEVKVSIRTTLQDKSDSDYNADGYAFWDGTAYASTNNGTVSSNMVRLWTTKKEGGSEPSGSYMLKYVFTGDVPNDAVLPNASAEKGNTQVTAAAEPTSALKGYSFDGWYRSDNGAKVTPGQQFDMPNSDLTLKGKWTLDEMNVQKITVKYEYTDNNDGKHVPDGAPVLSPELTVKVGQTHYIQKISQDTDYHKFGGWEPALSVDGKKVVLTKQSDGSYQGDGYIIDIANGTLSTEQFREKQDVVVTFSGAWIPYKGTIQFDNNGGEGVMEAMQNVTWDTTTQLPLNSFTNLDNSFQFTGWAKGPSGNVVKLDGDTADKLIDADGKTVTLYAVWKRGSYGVGYDLENVTSSNTSDTVTLNGQYSTTLAPANGYTMDSVKVTMGGIVITSQVYNPTTGEVTIPKALGNIVIKASANPLAPVVEHTITVSVTNGTANPSGKVKVRDGQNQIIKFTPNAGYVLSSVTVNDKPASLTGDSYTFTNVTSDQSIDVVYKKSDGGSVTHRYPIEVIFTGDGNAVSDKKVAAAGEKVMITVNGHVENIKATDSNGNEVAVKLNSDGKYVFNMPGSAVTVTINFTKEDETSGAITPEDTGVADLLDTVTHRAYLTGYKTGEFRPNYNITRAEVAQMFYNLLLDQNVPVTVSFDDVPADAWYAEAVNTLASMDILAGVGDNNFAPSRPITRAEFTAIAMRFTKGSVQGENIFSDVKEEDWFYQQVIGSIKYGWIGGYADGTFRPNKTITRAEVTTIVNKMLGRSADRNFVSHHLLELKRFIDFGHTHWAYYNIVEATNTHEYVKNENGEVWTK